MGFTSDQPVDPTTDAQPDDLLQRAVSLLYEPNDPITGVPRVEATRAATALVNAARELRLGRSKSRRYGDITRPADHTDEVVGVTWHPVEGVKGYDIKVRTGLRPQVVPVYSEESEGVSSET